MVPGTINLDQELNEMEYVFDGELLSKIEYIAYVMHMDVRINLR